jgi:hypothetical protein
MLTINHFRKSANPWEDLFREWVSSMSLACLPRAPELSNLNKAKEEVAMYDPNLKLRERTYMKNSDPTAWPDMVRQNRDSDVDLRLYKVHHENLMVSLAASLAGGLLRLLSNLLHVPARLMRQERGNLPMERHSPVDR